MSCWAGSVLDDHGPRLGTKDDRLEFKRHPQTPVAIAAFAAGVAADVCSGNLVAGVRFVQERTVGVGALRKLV